MSKRKKLDYNYEELKKILLNIRDYKKDLSELTKDYFDKNILINREPKMCATNKEKTDINYKLAFYFEKQQKCGSCQDFLIIYYFQYLNYFATV